MQIIHHISIDFARRIPTLPVDAVQGDGNTRILRIKLLENGEAWAVPEGITAAVAFRKPDGTKGLYDALPDGTKAVTMEGCTVSAVLATQVLTCPGEVTVSVVFHDEKLNQLAAFPFPIRVAANPAAGQTASNDYYYYSTMADISKAMETAMAALEESKQVFLAKAEEALQTVHDTATEDATAIVCEATGENISVADSAERPLKGLTIYGKTIQNGTPTPSAPVALESVGVSIGVTVAGKNLFGGGTKAFTQYIECACDILPGTYTFSTFATSSDTDLNVCSVGLNSRNGRIATLEIPRNIRTYQTFTVNEPIDSIWLYASSSASLSAGDTATFADMQIERGSVMTAYEPYKELQTLTVSAPGGLHGIGEVKDEIDFARGVRLHKLAKVDMGTLDWKASSGYTGRFQASVENIKYVAKDDGDILCNKYISQTNLADKSIFHYDKRVYVIDGDYSDAVAFKVAVSGAVLIYELDEPIETPLTAEELAQYAALHSNKPNTTAFNDAGAEMKLSYVADTKTYIDQKISSISAAMLNN